MPKTFHSSYLTRLQDPAALVRQAIIDLADVDFDTVVVTGLSGTLIGPRLADALGKYLLAVRKPNDDSHSWLPAEGTLGDRWVFADDFLITGETYQRVQDAVKRLDYPTKHVGVWTYEYSAVNSPGWHPAPVKFGGDF